MVPVDQSVRSWLKHNSAQCFLLLWLSLNNDKLPLTKQEGIILRTKLNAISVCYGA